MNEIDDYDAPRAYRPAQESSGPATLEFQQSSQHWLLSWHSVKHGDVQPECPSRASWTGAPDLRVLPFLFENTLYNHCWEQSRQTRRSLAVKPRKVSSSLISRYPNVGSSA